MQIGVQEDVDIGIYIVALPLKLLRIASIIIFLKCCLFNCLFTIANYNSIRWMNTTDLGLLLQQTELNEN